MNSNEYLGRHGGRAAALLLAGAVLSATAIGAAKADIRPDAQSDLARAILGDQAAPKAVATPAVVVQAPPPAPLFSFQTPIPGYAINSNFGIRRLPSEGYARMHEGVDIAAPAGVAIHSTAAGKVVDAGVSPSYGRFVEVDHGEGVHSFYAHMSRFAGLKVGETVAAGEVVGFVGSTGHSTGAHLHFEIRKDGLHFDPSLFVGRTFATLATMPFFRSAEFGYAKPAKTYRASARFRTSRRGGGRVGMTLRAAR